MKYARSNAAAAVCNGKIIICGGLRDEDFIRASVEQLDPESGVWTDLSPMPIPRRDHSLVFYNNMAVVAGGWYKGQIVSTIHGLGFNRKNGKWTMIGNVNATNSQFIGLVIDQEIFIIGYFGKSEGSNETGLSPGAIWHSLTVLIPQDLGNRLCLLQNEEKTKEQSISKMPSMIKVLQNERRFKQTIMFIQACYSHIPTKGAIMHRKVPGFKFNVEQCMEPSYDVIGLSGGAVGLNGNLYLIGGGLSGRHLFMMKFPKDNEIRTSWKRLADMHCGREDISHSCLECNGFIWVLGGLRCRTCLRSVERYDPRTNRWTFMPEMKYARASASAAVCNGKIIICGGRGADGRLMSSVECFDPENGLWTELTPMPTALYNHSLVYYNNMIIILGGYNEARVKSTVLGLNPKKRNGQWIELPEVPTTHHSFWIKFIGLVLDQEIFVIGNYDKLDPEVLIFDGSRWRNGPTISLYAERPYTIVTYVK